MPVTEQPRSGRVKRSTVQDAAVIAWLEEIGRREDRSVDWLIRRILREAMAADAASDG